MNICYLPRIVLSIKDKEVMKTWALLIMITVKTVIGVCTEYKSDTKL